MVNIYADEGSVAFKLQRADLVPGLAHTPAATGATQSAIHGLVKGMTPAEINRRNATFWGLDTANKVWLASHNESRRSGLSTSKDRIEPCDPAPHDPMQQGADWFYDDWTSPSDSANKPKDRTESYPASHDPMKQGADWFDDGWSKQLLCPNTSPSDNSSAVDIRDQAEIDRLRLTIAALSQRPSKEAYEAQGREIERLRGQVGALNEMVRQKINPPRLSASWEHLPDVTAPQRKAFPLSALRASHTSLLPPMPPDWMVG